MKIPATAARLLCLAAALLATPGAAPARPLYFENLVGIYGFDPGDDLYACGVCHRRWEGTGGRNPYGLAIEQRLYVGQSIVDAILGLAPEDTDGDGFSNGDELSVYGTLPGYSCATYGLARETPPNFQSLITPGVPTCLEPADIAVTPATLSFTTDVGRPVTQAVQISNNGSDLPITVSDLAFLPGSHASLGVAVPPLPLVIAVGQTVAVDVTFTPTASVIATGTLRVTSDDPDEPVLDVTVNGLAVVRPLAPPDVRARCLGDVEREAERLAKTHLREWGRCSLAELGGVACNAPARDIRIGKAEAKVRAVIGGERDRSCAAASVSPSLLGTATTCGTPCESIVLTSIARLADCVVCQQDAATEAMLAAVVGTVPPDLPPAVLAPGPLRCTQQLVSGTDKGIRAVQRALARCELDAIRANASVDCAAQLAATLADIAAGVTGRLASCTDTTGMLGCAFAPGGDPACVGTAAVDIGQGLVATLFPGD